MDSWQYFMQLRYILRAAVWAGGSKVFAANGVVVCADMPEDFLERIRLPCALIRIQDAPCDPENDEEPDIFGQSFDITVAVAHPNDPFGEAAFLGAGRAVTTDSSSKGLLEIERELWANIKSLGDASGVRVNSRGRSATGGTHKSNLEYIAWRTYRFEALIGAEPFYHPVTKLRAAVPGGGVVSLTWVRPGVRFDYRRMVLRRASGSVAPTSITGGTGVVLGGTPDGVSAVSVSDVPGAGTWSYAIFAVYDPYQTGTDVASSASATVTAVAT